MFFYVVFQASTGKNLREKNTEKISGPGDLMLNVPLECGVQLHLILIIHNHLPLYGDDQNLH